MNTRYQSNLKSVYNNTPVIELYSLPHCLSRHPLEHTLQGDGNCSGRDDLAGGVHCQPDHPGAGLPLLCQEASRAGQIAVMQTDH